jgi:hypothetical protein
MTKNNTALPKSERTATLRCQFLRYKTASLHGAKDGHEITFFFNESEWAGVAELISYFRERKLIMRVDCMPKDS